MTEIQTVEPAERERALKQLKKRRDFEAHLLIYVLVNTSVVLIWLLTSNGGYFWPIFFIAFWGVGLVMNAWDVWLGDPTDADIVQEIKRMKGRR